MEDCLLKEYALVDSENYEDYLQFIGIKYVAPKAAIETSHTHSLTKDKDGTYTLIFKSKLVNGTCTYLLEEEFVEVPPGGGVKAKCAIKIESNKIIHTQTEQNDRTLTQEREFYPEEMIVTTTVNDWEKIAKKRYVFMQ